MDQTKVNSNHRRKFIHNDRGSAFLQVLAAVVIMGMLLYNLMPSVLDYKSHSVKNTNLIDSRLAIHSVLDYTLVGIKQKWCFSVAWTPESCGKTMNDTISHPRSIDRLLMTQESIEYLKLLGVPNAASAKLDSIEYDLLVSQITTKNPVYKIFQSIDKNITKIKILISIDKNAALPQFGDEVYLKLDVSLMDNSGKVVKIGGANLQAVSYVGVYPREVATFALILANDLYLDKATPYEPKKGDAYIKKFAAKSADLISGGLTFSSPVFVNGNINLTSSKDKLAYTPVTFKEKVYLGAGMLMRDGAGFVPSTNGKEESQYWSDILQFGGFKGGVEIDGKVDLGLEYLSGLRTSATVNNDDLFRKCVANTAANSKLDMTANSLLQGALTSSKGDEFEYRLKLTDYNKFNVQSGSIPGISSKKYGNSGIEFKNGSYEKAHNGSAIKFTLKVGNLDVFGTIPDGGSAIVNLSSNVQGMINTYQNSLNSANQTLSQNKNRISQLQNQIKNIENNIDSLEGQISNLEKSGSGTGGSGGNANSGQISNLENQIWNLKNQRNNMRNEITSLNNENNSIDSNIAQLSSTLSSYQKMNGQVSTIKLSADKIGYNGGGGKGGNSSYRNLEIETSNEQGIIDESGNKLNVKIVLEAMDVSYENYHTKRTDEQSNNNGMIELNWVNNILTPSKNIKDPNGTNRSEGTSEDMYTNLDEQCKTVDYSSFASASWTSSFSAVSTHSWSFTNAYNARTDYVFNAGNASVSGGKVPAFVVRSIVKNCIIEADANFVTGFLTCERLTIRPRSLPLTIVGTFIVTNGLTIDDSAYKAGIRWQSIYNPVSTRLLRSAKVLKSIDGQSCDTLPRTPVWHPRPSLLDRVNNQQCNAISLRLKADPFRWTSVDPDCGLLDTSSTATFCKNSIGNYIALEIHRESGI